MSPVNEVISMSVSLTVVITALYFVREFSVSPINTYVYHQHCSQPNSFLGSSFFRPSYEKNVNKLLTMLVESASHYKYDHLTIDGNTKDAVNGFYHCRGNLSSDFGDCLACVSHAVSRLQSVCGSSAWGGELLLESCFVRYDKVLFLGVQDKRILVRMCGTPSGYSSKELSRTTALMDKLVAKKGNSYRVGTTPEAQGVVECTGDLSTSDCQECLTEAIQQLRALCGRTAWGEVHLAKCYVRHLSRGATGDDKGTKKTVFHVLSNRVNDLGFDRPEAYVESDPFKPGPGRLKEEFI